MTHIHTPKQLMSKIIITIDLEKDISKYIKNSYKGIEEGLPHLFDILSEFKIISDFFTTADICEKYPEIINQIISDGHNIGCHSYDHSIEFYGSRSFREQYDDLCKATNSIERITGLKPRIFRAPNFSINGNTIKVLEKLNYKIDSSILPGRVVKKWRIFKIYDYRNTQAVPYHPSYDDVRKSGASSIIEVPLTENPFLKGNPVGVGYLNYYGYKKTIEILNNIENDYVMFLIHPWELVDLVLYYPYLRKWLHKACSGDLEPLRMFLEYVSKDKNHTFSTIEEVVSSSSDFSLK